MNFYLVQFFRVKHKSESHRSKVRVTVRATSYFMVEEDGGGGGGNKPRRRI